jgi:Arc/MetJ family transcription regulator
MCMKRQNLMINEVLLKEAQETLGLRTFSDTVNHALREALRVEKLKKMTELFGKIEWDGDLKEIRKQRTRTKKS